MFQKICALALVVAGCAAPTNKYSAIELSRDQREFTTATAQGGFKLGEAKVFGNVDLNSPFNGADTTDLTRFNGRARLVRPIYNGFGLTAEYKDAVGDNNVVGGVGFSYSPIKGVEVRAYPLRTDGESQEVCLSFGKVFDAGSFDPYVRGFFDFGESDKKYSVGEIQVGLRSESGWRLVAEVRHSDAERRSGFANPGVRVGIGVDF